VAGGAGGAAHGGVDADLARQAGGAGVAGGDDVEGGLAHGGGVAAVGAGAHAHHLDHAVLHHQGGDGDVAELGFLAASKSLVRSTLFETTMRDLSITISAVEVASRMGSTTKPRDSRRAFMVTSRGCMGSVGLGVGRCSP